MDGITDAPMRELQGSLGAFTYAVSEFVRVSIDPIPVKVFLREIPEIANGGQTPTGMPVQVQILGGDPGRMGESAATACRAGATAIDINFGCPAPTVNRNDGGASLLRTPCRIRDVVQAVRSAVPAEIPVSAKLRLGWDHIDQIFANAAMAAEGGASWLTIHARTRTQAYNPPVFWPHIGRVREQLGLPIIANGDIWTLDDFRRCQDETGCQHFMIGRGALARPTLPFEIASELGLSPRAFSLGWEELLQRFVSVSDEVPREVVLQRLKQWMKLASRHGEYDGFDRVKRAASLDEFFAGL